MSQSRGGKKKKKLSSSLQLDATLPVGCEEQAGTGSDAH